MKVMKQKTLDVHWGELISNAIQKVTNLQIELITKKENSSKNLTHTKTFILMTVGELPPRGYETKKKRLMGCVQTRLQFE